MSDSVALALIITTDFFAWIGYLYTSKLMFALTAEIVAGFTQGVPTPTAWRRKLTEKFAFLISSVVAMMALGAGVNAKIASASSDAGVTTLAYFGAYIGALVAVSWSVVAWMDVRYFRSLIRQAEAAKDSP